MNGRIFLFPILLASFLLVSTSGCAPKRPPVVPVQGVVLLNGRPLPNAAVGFYPLIDGFGPEMNSVGYTDEEGRFTMKCNWQDEKGAAVAKHKILVHESPPPPETSSGESGPNDRGARRPVTPPTGKLPNRPIPEKYGNLGTTPLEIDVKAGQSEYKIELNRD